MLKNILVAAALLTLTAFYNPASGQVWTQLGVDMDGEATFDNSGFSVSMSADGQIVAIGGPNNNGGTPSTAGHVRVYEFISGVWAQQGADIDGETQGDNSGRSISLSADGLLVAIGAVHNDGLANNSGGARVYKLISGSWVQQGADLDGESNSDNFGESVSLSADGLTVAIGAPGDDSAGTNAGYVQVYKLISGNWVQQGSDIEGEAAGDQTGNSVNLSADGLTVAIGATGSDETGNNSGHVRVYILDSGTWVQQGADIDGESADDRSGGSVSLNVDGLTVAIAAKWNNGTGQSAGHVRVYKLISGNWVQQGVDIDGEAALDNSGSSVSISADGLRVAIGATQNNGTADFAGHVRVFEFISGTWVQQGADIDGENEDDLSGRSVSLSSDGLTVAIGAQGSDGTGNNAGHVRVYSFGPSVGLEENDLFIKVSVFPNPNTGTVNIDLAGLKDVSIQVINTVGQLVYNKANISNGIHQFELKEAPGIYFVELRRVSGETQRYKLMMQ
jgi:hypothetical protein